MCLFTAREATQFFRSYEITCDEDLVRKWLIEANFVEPHPSISEEHAWAFNDWLRQQGTSYEKGINEKMKIERLIFEVQQLEKENEKLRNEKLELELRLGISPFD